MFAPAVKAPALVVSTATFPKRVTARVRVTTPPAVVMLPEVLKVPARLAPKVTTEAPEAVMAALTVVVPDESNEMVPLAVLMAAVRLRVLRAESRVTAPVLTVVSAPPTAMLPVAVVRVMLIGLVSVVVMVAATAELNAPVPADEKPPAADTAPLSVVLTPVRLTAPVVVTAAKRVVPVPATCVRLAAMIAPGSAVAVLFPAKFAALVTVISASGVVAPTVEAKATLPTPAVKLRF
jgi:hypothetical protein